MEQNAPLVRHGYLTEADRRDLIAARAVGDIGTRFFTVEGRPVEVLDDRLIAVDWAVLDAIPQVVAVAAGVEKIQAALGALRTGLIETLITDE